MVQVATCKGHMIFHSAFVSQCDIVRTRPMSLFIIVIAYIFSTSHIAIPEFMIIISTFRGHSSYHDSLHKYICASECL